MILPLHYRPATATINKSDSALALTVLLAFCGAVDAKPSDYIIQFNLHENKRSPYKRQRSRFTPGIIDDRRDGNSVGWEVIVVTIRRLGVNCDVANTWSKHIPFVDTADGPGGSNMPPRSGRSTANSSFRYGSRIPRHRCTPARHRGCSTSREARTSNLKMDRRSRIRHHGRQNSRYQDSRRRRQRIHELDCGVMSTLPGRGGRRHHVVNGLKVSKAIAQLDRQFRVRHFDGRVVHEILHALGHDGFANDLFDLAPRLLLGPSSGKQEWTLMALFFGYRSPFSADFSTSQHTCHKKSSAESTLLNHRSSGPILARSMRTPR